MFTIAHVLNFSSKFIVGISIDDTYFGKFADENAII